MSEARATNSGWAMQQLAGFLSGISTYPDERSMMVNAVHRIAESVDAEVAALVQGGQVVAALGFPADQRHEESLLDVVAGRTEHLEVPGLGEVPTRTFDLHLERPAKLIVARATGGFETEEHHLLRSLAQVLEMALELRRSADEQRALRHRSDDQAAALRDANRRLIEASRVKSDLVSMASHELRTPLTAILGFSETLLLRWDDVGDDRRIMLVERVRDQGRRLLRLVEDLLTVGRLDGGRLEARPAPVSLTERVRTLLEAPGYHGVELEVPDDDVTVHVDPEHLEQMVDNLLTNALKYGRPPVCVEVTQDERTGRLTVVDHGDGVPPDFEPAMFERFTQASTGDQRRGAGTGLGLSIVAGLAEMNRATITYARRGATSRFELTLPRGPETLDRPQRPPTERSRTLQEYPR